MKTMRSRYSWPVFLLLVASGLTGSLSLLLYKTILSNLLKLPDPDNLVFVLGAGHDPGMPWPRGWNDGAFTDLSGFQILNLLVGEDSPRRRVKACLADQAFFGVLGVKPERGRFLTDDDAAKGAVPVAVISHSLWKSYFGGNENLPELMLNVSGQQMKVVGVLPAGLDFPADSDVYLPRHDGSVEFPSSGGTRSSDVFLPNLDLVMGRLRNGITLQQAREREKAVLLRSPNYRKGQSVYVDRVQNRLTIRIKDQVTLLAVAGCLVAIVSLGSLLLLSSARAAESRKNTAVRMVLGGTVSSLWRDEILWWLWIGGLGSSVIIFGTGFLATVIRKMQGLSVPRLNEIGLGAPQALYIFLATIAAACLLSLPYILSSIRLKELTPILNRAGFQSEIKLKPIMGRLVTFAQLALALALTATALRVCVHYFHLASIPAGIDASNVFVASADPILSRDGSTPSLVTGTAKANKKDSARETKDKDKVAAKGEADGLAEKIRRKENLDRKTLLLTQELARRPGVASIAAVNLVPFGVFAGSGQFVAPSQGGPETFAAAYTARGDLPRTLGLSMLAGRWFDQNDEAGSTRDVVVVSKALSEQSYGGQAVGKQLWIGGEQSPRNIVGVVNDVLADFGEEIQPAFFVPLTPGRDKDIGLYALAVKMSSPGAVPPQINLPANSELQYGDWTSLSKMMEEAGVTDRVSALTAAWFAGFALLLAATSTYAVAWTMTMQRQREMAIRMSFGASPIGLALRTFRDGAALALLAGAGGLAIEKALERWLWSHFYGFPAFSWFSFAASLAVILAMTILAATAPARSIVALSPCELLREN